MYLDLFQAIFLGSFLVLQWDHSSPLNRHVLGSFFLGDRFNFSFRKHFFFHLPPFWKMISPIPPHDSANDWQPQVLGGSSQLDPVLSNPHL